MTERTPRGIAYDWWVTGPDGAWFELCPEMDVHSPDDVEASKRWLRNNFDVLKIKVLWHRGADRTRGEPRDATPAVELQTQPEIDAQVTDTTDGSVSDARQGTDQEPPA